MDRPSKVRILGKTWALLWPTKVDEQDSHGQTLHAGLSIDVCPDYPHEHQQDTLLHELLHAIDEELALGMGERRVRNVATVLLGIMKDNPEVRDFIFNQPTVPYPDV